MKFQHFKDLYLDSRIILKRSSKNEMGMHGLHYVAQNRDKWPAVGNTIMKLRVP